MAVQEEFDAGNGLIRGDVFPRRWRVSRLSGALATKAYLTVKADPENDADAAAVFQLSITTVSGASGQIENAGAQGTAVLRFDLSATNTRAVTAGVLYEYDVQLHLDDDRVITVVKGPFIAAEEVTRADT